MTLTLLVVIGGFLYWIGLINVQRIIELFGLGLLIAAFAVLFWHGGVDPIAIPLLLAIGALILLLKHSHRRRWLLLGWALFVVIAVALKVRVIPLFSPVESIQAMAGDGLHIFRFPPEKIVLIILVSVMVLLPWSHHNRERTAAKSWLSTLLIFTATALAILPIALWTDFIVPGWTSASVSFLAYWLSYNLIYTCVIEEAFFRGILQTAFIRELSRRLPSVRARAIGILSAGVLFGVAHFAGGFTYVILASIAGIGYGLAYDVSGRLHHAVLVHFTINAVHKLAFAGS